MLILQALVIFEKTNTQQKFNREKSHVLENSNVNSMNFKLSKICNCNKENLNIFHFLFK